MLFAAPESVTTKVRVESVRLLCLSRISTCSPGGGISRRILSTRPEHASLLTFFHVLGETAEVIGAGNGILCGGDEVPGPTTDGSGRVRRAVGVDEEISRGARGKVVVAEVDAKV